MTDSPVPLVGIGSTRTAEREPFTNCLHCRSLAAVCEFAFKVHQPPPTRPRSFDKGFEAGRKCHRKTNFEGRGESGILCVCVCSIFESKRTCAQQTNTRSHKHNCRVEEYIGGWGLFSPSIKQRRRTTQRLGKITQWPLGSDKVRRGNWQVIRRGVSSTIEVYCAKASKRTQEKKHVHGSSI